jgi:hypothetical protein
LHNSIDSKIPAYLPFVKLVLLGFVLLDEVVQDLLQPLGVRPESGDDILDGPLRQDAINHAEALAVTRKGIQGFENKSGAAVSDER